jgi:hypothetical protein
MSRFIARTYAIKQEATAPLFSRVKTRRYRLIVYFPLQSTFIDRFPASL